MYVMGTMGTLPALVSLGSFVVLACVNAEVVVLGEGFGTDSALKRAWSIEEVDMLVKVDVVFLAGMVIALWALVWFLSSVGMHVNAYFGLVTEQFGALRTFGGLRSFGGH